MTNEEYVKDLIEDLDRCEDGDELLDSVTQLLFNAKIETEPAVIAEPHRHDNYVPVRISMLDGSVITAGWWVYTNIFPGMPEKYRQEIAHCGYAFVPFSVDAILKHPVTASPHIQAAFDRLKDDCGVSGSDYFASDAGGLLAIAAAAEEFGSIAEVAVSFRAGLRETLCRMSDDVDIEKLVHVIRNLVKGNLNEDQR